MPHIPPEVLLQILAHVRENGGPSYHINLLSCSMVSRFWFDYAWPLAAEFFNQPLNLGAYTTAQLDRVVNAIIMLRQLGVLKTTLLTSVVAAINSQLFEQTAYGSRADISLRLVHALQPPSKSLEIYIPHNFGDKQAANIHDFVSRFHPATASLRVSREIYCRRFVGSSEPLKRLSNLIHNLRHQLQDISILIGAEIMAFESSFIRALSNCPNIRSASLSAFNASDLSAIVFSWPELRSLKILGTSSSIDPIVEQLAMNTPKHLESLHLNSCRTPQLRNLIISLAPRLVHLQFPTVSLGTSDEFFALITSLDMPCLQHLDIIYIMAHLLTVNVVVQRHWVEGQSNPMFLLRWPKLQSISLCLFEISPLFLKLVMASCPALESMRCLGQKDLEILVDAGWHKIEIHHWIRHRGEAHKWDRKPVFRCGDLEDHGVVVVNFA